MSEQESKHAREWSKEDLLSLPERKWDDESPEYNSLLLLSTGATHDSGWAMIAVIGCVDYKPVEIATQCADDLCWTVPPKQHEFETGQIRTDCCVKSGALHFWRRNGKFKVGCALSSTDITIL